MLKKFTIEGRAHGAKFEISLERRVTSAWEEAEALGWSYGRFVAHILGILAVLSYRNHLSETKEKAQP